MGSLFVDLALDAYELNRVELIRKAVRTKTRV
jgi:hypothetical protein